MRVREIDVFRGLSIVLMVFFTLLYRLSDSLPDFLTHNEPASLHLGDFVLPMFLFASGMSLVFFSRKRESRKKLDRVLDIIERFGMLAGLGILLSPFSSGEMFGMDEVMLSAILFVFTMVALRFSDRIVLGIGLSVFIIYFALSALHLLPDFSAHYLGGYPAALFYLPVMLGGALAARHLDKPGMLFAGSALLFGILLIMVPPYKMSASPSFMALSVVFSLGIFSLMTHVRSKKLEYLGRRPIRYWVLMFIVFLVPVGIYTNAVLLCGNLGMGWIPAVITAVIAVPVLFLVSKGLDFCHGKLGESWLKLLDKIGKTPKSKEVAGGRPSNKDF